MPKNSQGRKNKKHYFTKVHEDAIIQYAKSDCVKERTRLYIDFIQPAFNEMVDKIVYTYKFTSLPNIDPLKDECKIWLTTILDKYDPSKGSKAFSYFSVITKNWFIHKVKKTSKQNKQEVDFEDIPKSIVHEKLVTYNQYEIRREKEEFWTFFYEEVDSWDTGTLKINEHKVLQAVKILFDSSDDIEIFNKKAVYLYMRELTGLNTKQIVNNLNKMRQKYREFRKKWNKGEI
ncbi:MAG: hypothetical protein CMB80_02395 [Flammeovirgaceae bacterium]|nr:hypothetical protein [Flammeovirgaceae bacterium]